MKTKNFGENVVYNPKDHYAPETAEEVLDILDRHKAGQVRVESSGHSWSDVVRADDAYINLKHFNSVRVAESPDGPVAQIGAGAKLQYILDELHATSDYTLPTMGGVKRQTIAGATATATHGTGKTSLSNYITAVKIACYDENGNPQIKTIDSGDDLLAARCSLGCLGVILEITLRVVPKFWMREELRKYEGVADILREEGAWPQQQFLVFPYSWDWYAYHRKEVGEPTEKQKKKMKYFKWFDYIAVELGLHTFIKIIAWKARFLGRWVITGFWKYMVPPFMRPHEVVGDSETILTLHTEHHYTFRHVEMELFIKKEHVRAIAEFMQEVIPFFAGASKEVAGDVADKLRESGLFSELESLRGSYTHHYPIFFRHILSEDTLIAMNEGSERYSMSIFTFDPPKRQNAYYRVCTFLARSLAKLYDVRPHWGKYQPLGYDELVSLYGNLDKFRDVCRRYDPNGVFQNSYTKRVLNIEV